MNFNQIWPIGAAVLVNMMIGFIYYNPKVFGSIWIKEAKLDEVEMKKMNMTKLMGFSLLFALMISISLNYVVVHQAHLESIAMKELSSTDTVVVEKAKTDIAAFKTNYGNSFLTFKHGAFHGFMFCLFFVLPIIGMNSLYENRTWKHIFIHVGYWAISLSLMGGIISATA